MILSEQGELTYDNSCARRICQHLLAKTSQTLVPAQVWRCCQALIESRALYHPNIIVEDEIQTDVGMTIRIRVRWLDPNHVDHLLLVTLEDQQQSARHRAYAEAQRYGLTDRETEVWLLKRAGLTYKAIAAQLYIAEDTVKKHIKNIHARRDASQWLNHCL
ncbi:MAG: helix-turn-helix transcriptional regulator [Leptolyngbyaceae cyanobacterium CRU_2_3]|nr:helix-turn-helix transcriptional regulator [Leptolyngbyaceae cyanobacterium CRU_2_3]